MLNILFLIAIVTAAVLVAYERRERPLDDTKLVELIAARLEPDHEVSAKTWSGSKGDGEPVAAEEE